MRIEKTRVALVVSWKNNEMLLGAPNIPSGTGKDPANVCIELVYKWNIAQQVRGLVFDSTASNTRINTGACTLIEKALGRKLVWVACRHYIMEVVLSSVFKAVMGDTTGPCVEVFKRFQSQWDVINKKNFDLPDEADFQEFVICGKKQKKLTLNYLIQLFHVMITESFLNLT